MVGVYTWANGIKARIRFENNDMIFDNRLIYPESDFRLEYRGNVKNHNVMDGYGILTVKTNDEKTFLGNWADDVIKGEQQKELKEIEDKWK